MPTPRSTPLPAVPTPVLFGTEAQPLTVGVVLAEVNSEVQQAKRDLASQLNENMVNERLERLGLTASVEVESFNTMREALEAVCSNRAALVWVDAFTYIAAEQACGAASVFAVQQTARESVDGLPARTVVDADTGWNFDVVYKSELGTLTDGLAGLADRRICRLGPEDALSWVYFSLALRSTGIDPISGLAAIVDVDDYEAMIREIQDEEGACDAGAVPRGTLDEIVNALADADDPIEIDLTADDAPIRLLPNTQATWPEVPHSVLIAPPNSLLAPDLRESLVLALRELINSEDADALENLHVLLDFEEIVPVTPSDYEDFRQWLQAAGWQMGR